MRQQRLPAGKGVMEPSVAIETLVYEEGGANGVNVAPPFLSSRIAEGDRLPHLSYPRLVS